MTFNLFERIGYSLKHPPMIWCSSEWWEVRKQILRILGKYGLMLSEEAPNPYMLYFKHIKNNVIVEIRTRDIPKATPLPLFEVEVHSEDRDVAYGVGYLIKNEVELNRFRYHLIVLVENHELTREDATDG